MSGNSSSTSSSLLLYPFSSILVTFLFIKSFLLLPLSTFVLYLGLQRWRQQRSSTTWSHTDMFTYHLCVMELLWVCGSLSHLSSLLYLLVLAPAGIWMCSMACYGEMLFHVLTCAERYVAVVHPVVYLTLKSRGGVRIRNISMGCVWLLCVGLAGLHVVTEQFSSNMLSLCLVLSIAMTSFCSLSVLCVLIRPGPGEGGGDKERVDQSKQRAFNTITAIMSVQMFWFLGLLVSAVALESKLMSVDAVYLVGMSMNFCNLPSTLVLPLLYLYRAGKLTPCCLNTEHKEFDSI